MTREEILKAAHTCICGGREQDYGEPENNFETIARLWSVYLSAAHLYKYENLLTKTDVAMMMALLKIARIAGGAGVDSFVDLAGYAACAGEIEWERLKRQLQPQGTNPNQKGATT